MARQFMNNLESALTVQLDVGQTVLTLPPTDSARMDDATPANFYTLTLDDQQGAVEICRVTAANGVTGECTVIRAQEDTAEQTWPIGSLVESRLTAGGLDDIRWSPDRILTADGDVLVGPDGNVLIA